VQRLRDLGWIEGRNVAIEVRWAEGRTKRYGGNRRRFREALGVEQGEGSTPAPKLGLE